eukprot:193521_1
MMKLGADEQRTKQDISLSIPVHRHRVGSTVGTKSIRNSNLSGNNSNDAAIAVDEVDPVVLAKCQMKCLSLFLFVPTLIFTVFGFISLLYSFYITHSYSPITGEIIDFYHCGCEGQGGSGSGSSHKTIILKQSGRRYQNNQERSSNGTSASHDQNKIQNESGDGSELEAEAEVENACTPIFGSIIEYCDYDGQKHSFPSDICTNSKPIIGKKNKVYFNPRDTSNGKDGSFRCLWYFPLLSIIVGLVPAAFLAILRWRREDLLKHQIRSIQQQLKEKQEQMRQKGEEQSLLSKGACGGDLGVARECNGSATDNASMSSSNYRCSRSGVLTLDISNDNNFVDAEKSLEMTSRM